LKKNYPPINLGSPGEDISSKDLHAIIQRFKHLNQFRLLSVQNFLQTRQRLFLDLLPLIFHQNQASLPGFTSTETPSGIQDYSPSKQTVKAAKQLSKGYRFTRKALSNYAIEGIFLMGSVGSIAFSKTSDMDIWLCHKPSLPLEDIAELQKKADSLEKWAQSLNLEVHFFLMNSEQFRQGQDLPLSSESSGQTQHYLLLEEFYRTAIYIAGKAPAWWLVPPHQNHNYNGYIQHLLENRFISTHEVIDFGGLQSVPAEEFISATLWHIYKSLDSPYKSLLKLFLMECYASEYPHPQWIAQNLKAAIYQGNFDINKLDPYLLIYEKVEVYLDLVASQKRLALARQCFYLKIMGSSDKSLDLQSRLFREHYLQNIAQQWHWPEDMLENFSRHKFWDISKATREHIIIRDQLKQCLQMILRFAGKYVSGNYRDNQDLKLIGRKLHTFLDQKPGKVEVISTRSSVHKKEDELSIIEIDQDHTAPRWYLYSGYVSAKQPALSPPIKECEGFLELLCWLIINGLYQQHLKLHFESLSPSTNDIDINLLVRHLYHFFSSWWISKKQMLETYRYPNQLLSSQLFINLGEPLAANPDNMQLVMSHRSDPLSYGKDRQCFVQTIHQVSISSWGEITLSQYEGLEGVFQCLSEIFNQSILPVNHARLEVVCLTPLRAKTISLRIKTVFNRLIKLFTSSLNWRYVLPAENSYFIFKLQAQTLHYWNIETRESLLQELASTQLCYSPVSFDNYVLDNTLIPFLYTHISENSIQVFYHSTKNHVILYVIDERAALFTRQYQHTKPHQILSNYLSFLNRLQDRAKLSDNIQIKFYEILKNSADVASCQPVKVKPQGNVLNLNIRVTAETANNQHHLTIFCNDEKFSSRHSRNIFTSVRQYIQTFRQSTTEYPFHINEIDVPCQILGVDNLNHAHTILYLKYKQKIESKLAHIKT